MVVGDRQEIAMERAAGSIPGSVSDVLNAPECLDSLEVLRVKLARIQTNFVLRIIKFWKTNNLFLCLFLSQRCKNSMSLRGNRQSSAEF